MHLWDVFAVVKWNLSSLLMLLLLAIKRAAFFVYDVFDPRHSQWWKWAGAGWWWNWAGSLPVMKLRRQPHWLLPLSSDLGPDAVTLWKTIPHYFLPGWRFVQKSERKTKTNTYPFVWQSEQSKIWLYLFQQKVKNNYPNFGSEHSSVKSNETCWCRWLNTVVLCLLHHGYILKGDHTWGSVTGHI